MPTLIDAPAIIEAAGTKPKRIEEYAGRVNSGHTAIKKGLRGHRVNAVTNFFNKDRDRDFFN